MALGFSGSAGIKNNDIFDTILLAEQKMNHNVK